MQSSFNGTALRPRFAARGAASRATSVSVRAVATPSKPPTSRTAARSKVEIIKARQRHTQQLSGVLQNEISDFVIC